VVITDGLVGDGFPHDPPPGMKVIIVLVGASAERIPYADWAKTVLTDSAKKKLGHAA